jgi:hypothetical protein
MFAANSVDDLVLKQHLDSLAAGYYGKFKVNPTSSLSLSLPCTQRDLAGISMKPAPASFVVLLPLKACDLSADSSQNYQEHFLSCMHADVAMLQVPFRYTVMLLQALLKRRTLGDDRCHRNVTCVRACTAGFFWGDL